MSIKTLRRKPSKFASDLMRLYRLPRRDVAAAERVFTTVTVPAGTDLAWEGSTTRQLVLVLDGEVEVTRAGERIALLGPGGVIGEITALNVRHEQTASARALTECRIAAAGLRDLAGLKDATGLYLHMQHLASVRTLSPAR